MLPRKFIERFAACMFRSCAVAIAADHIGSRDCDCCTFPIQIVYRKLILPTSGEHKNGWDGADCEPRSIKSPPRSTPKFPVSIRVQPRNLTHERAHSVGGPRGDAGLWAQSRGGCRNFVDKYVCSAATRSKWHGAHTLRPHRVTHTRSTL